MEQVQTTLYICGYCTSVNQAFGIFNTIVMMGVFQALIMSILLWRQPVQHSSKTLLSVVLVVLALLAIKILVHTMGWWNIPPVKYLPLAIDTLLQPLLYFYTLSLTKQGFTLTRRDWPHFILPGLFLLHGLVVYVCTIGLEGIVEKDGMAMRLGYNIVKRIEDVVAILSAIVYWSICFREVTRYRRWLFAGESATRYPELFWMRNLLTGFAVLVVLLAISSLGANLLHWPGGFRYLVVFYLYLTFLIYFLSFRGYAMTLPGIGVTPDLATSHPVVQDVEVSSTDMGPAPSPLIREALLKVMQDDKPYLEPELNLNRLAAIAGVPAAQVSAVINHYFGQNFRNWINGYRVEEVKRRLANPAYTHLNMTGIAFDCGFNSEASFYRIFRQFTGQSPKAYLQSLNKRG